MVASSNEVKNLYQSWAIRGFMLERTPSEAEDYAEAFWKASRLWTKSDYEHWRETHAELQALNSKMNSLNERALRRWLEHQIQSFSNALEHSGMYCE